MSSRKVLFIISSAVAHGAEQVLMDTLGHPSMTNQFEVLGPNVPEIREGFESRGVHYRSSRWLNPTGAGKTGNVNAIVRKILLWMIGSAVIFKVSREYDIVIGNNSGDCVWAPATRMSGKPFYLWVHDDHFYRKLAIALKIGKPFVQKYIACSLSVENALHSSLGIEISSTIIPNGLSDIDWKLRDPQSILTIGWIGTMEDRKDPLWFLDVLQNLAECGITACGKMVYKPLDALLEDKVRHHPAVTSGLVNLIGPLKRQDIWAYLSRIDYLLISSKRDPLPTVILEAYRSGTPVLGRSIPSIATMIDHMETGFLFSCPQEAHQYLKDLSKDDWMCMSGVARKRYCERYSIDKKRILLNDLVMLEYEKVI
jgi:glycosyltransferase involved in cell wall biosynthesis